MIYQLHSGVNYEKWRQTLARLCIFMLSLVVSIFSSSLLAPAISSLEGWRMPQIKFPIPRSAIQEKSLNVMNAGPTQLMSIDAMTAPINVTPCGCPEIPTTIFGSLP